MAELMSNELDSTPENRVDSTPDIPSAVEPSARAQILIDSFQSTVKSDTNLVENAERPAAGPQSSFAFLRGQMQKIAAAVAGTLLFVGYAHQDDIRGYVQSKKGTTEKRGESSEGIPNRLNATLSIGNRPQTADFCPLLGSSIEGITIEAGNDTQSRAQNALVTIAMEGGRKHILKASYGTGEVILRLMPGADAGPQAHESQQFMHMPLGPVDMNHANIVAKTPADYRNPDPRVLKVGTLFPNSHPGPASEGKAAKLFVERYRVPVGNMFAYQEEIRLPDMQEITKVARFAGTVAIETADGRRFEVDVGVTGKIELVLSDKENPLGQIIADGSKHR